MSKGWALNPGPLPPSLCLCSFVTRYCLLVLARDNLAGLPTLPNTMGICTACLHPSSTSPRRIGELGRFSCACGRWATLLRRHALSSYTELRLSGTNRLTSTPTLSRLRRPSHSLPPARRFRVRIPTLRSPSPPELKMGKRQKKRGE